MIYESFHRYCSLEKVELNECDRFSHIWGDTRTGNYRFIDILFTGTWQKHKEEVNSLRTELYTTQQKLGQQISAYKELVSHLIP